MFTGHFGHDPFQPEKNMDVSAKSMDVSAKKLDVSAKIIF